MRRSRATGRRTRRPWILATTLVAACLLPTDEGAGFGELRVMPTFDAGAEPDVTGVEIDSIRTVVRRPGEDGGPVVDQVRPYHGPADVLTWLIHLRASSEDMDVVLELRAGARTLYQGGRAVIVRNGSLGKEAIDEIPVAYIGSEVADRIEISPPRAAFTRTGLSQQLEGLVYAAGDVALPGYPLDWSSADESVVTVDQTGLITSTGFGATYVVATADGLADTASVVVDATLARHSTISADPTAIPANGEATSLITVDVLDETGEPVGASAGVVTLATTLGELGPVTDHGDGSYTATLTAGTAADTATITGTLDGAAIGDTATVAFTAGDADLTATEITAEPDSIPADGSSTSLITVRVRDEHGNLVGESAGEVALLLDRSDLASLGDVEDEGDGTYTATLTAGAAVGTVTITGTLNGDPMDDAAVVELTEPIDQPPFSYASITAAPTSIEADGESASTVTVGVFDSNDQLIGQSAGIVTLSPAPGGLAGLGPVTDHGDGSYTATLTAGTTAGSVTITGTLNGQPIDDSAVVRLMSGSGNWIEHNTVKVDEGSAAFNMGAFGDLTGEDVVFTASTGTVVGTGGGGWSWSFATTDGPSESRVVTIEGSDGHGVESGVTFELVVQNVAPLVDAGTEGTVESGSVLGLSGSFSDPGVLDSPWSWSIDWGDGASSDGTTTSQGAVIEASHRFCATGAYTITLSVTDKDGDAGSDQALWTVSTAGIRIMIMPTDSPNSISLSRRGVLPVAVLSSDGFDATGMDPATITLGDEVGSDTPVAQRPNGSLFAATEDVDGDGRPDLVLHFRVPALVENGDLTPTTTRLVLRGSGDDGCAAYRGEDSVRVLP